MARRPGRAGRAAERSVLPLGSADLHRVCVCRRQLGLSERRLDAVEGAVFGIVLAAISLTASMLVLKIVSSKLRPPTKPPVFTSIVVSASVWSMIR